MNITVVADEERWKECRTKISGQHHGVVHVRNAAAISGKPDLILYLRDEEFIQSEMVLLKEYKCPIFCNALVYKPIEGDIIIVRLNGWPGFLLREIIEVATHDKHKIVASRILDELGWKYRWVPDVVGLVSARIIATIINEAYYAVGDGVSGKAEIDTAMRLGTNYPKGPFEWCEQIGIKNVFVLLTKLSETNKRYTPAPQLIYESENAWH